MTQTALQSHVLGLGPGLLLSCMSLPLFKKKVPVCVHLMQGRTRRLKQSNLKTWPNTVALGSKKIISSVLVLILLLKKSPSVSHFSFPCSSPNLFS